MTKYIIPVLIGILVGGGVSAADITLSVDRAALKVDDTIAVTIQARVPVGEAFSTANHFLAFDKTKFECTAQAGGTAGVLVPDARGLDAINASGEIHAGAFTVTGVISGNVTLGVFRLKALAAGATAVSTKAYAAGTVPFGNLLVRADGTQVVPSTPGPLTLTISGAAGNGGTAGGTGQAPGAGDDGNEPAPGKAPKATPPAGAGAAETPGQAGDAAGAGAAETPGQAGDAAGAGAAETPGQAGDAAGAGAAETPGQAGGSVPPVAGAKATPTKTPGAAPTPEVRNTTPTPPPTAGQPGSGSPATRASGGTPASTPAAGSAPARKTKPVAPAKGGGCALDQSSPAAGPWALLLLALAAALARPCRRPATAMVAKRPGAGRSC